MFNNTKFKDYEIKKKQPRIESLRLADQKN